MSGIEAEALILLFIAFVMGAFIGVVAIASYAYRREDRRGSLSGRVPGAVCKGARRLTGVGTIGPVGPAGWIVPEQHPGGEAGQRTETQAETRAETR